ncbi:hypothetical protein RRG08_012497 [Elysia crispata]|uniref:WW domain binding protein VOPP1 n=1 Tax=Elysia crispata TaxID=231223 RepID=A0AAE1E2N8_9GAST|nr:hypothetical protein RRG08_012497 [Elysia crispata]
MSSLIILGLLSLLSEVFGEHCNDGSYCDSPSKCCETRKGCCYDSLMQSKHFRLQVWNMWYFWFLVIFMMMSCFGGCGYYRRRRLAMLSHSPGSSPTGLSPTISPAHAGSNCRGQERSGRQFNFFAYNGPGNVGMYPVPQYHQPPLVASMPPAYAEVVNQPGVYPVNGKTGLPPYPGQSKTENDQMVPSACAGASVWPLDDSSLPPPYTEFVTGPGPDPPHSQQQPESLEHIIPSQESFVPPPPPPSSSLEPNSSSAGPVEANTCQDRERTAESLPSERDSNAHSAQP